MRLGFFCNEYPPRDHGGIGVFVQVTARLLFHNGHDVTVVEFGTMAGKRQDEGVKIITLRRSRVPKFGWLLDRIHLWWWLMLAGRAGAFDVFELPEFEGWLPLPLFNSSITVVVRLHQSAKALSQVTGVPKLKPVFICEYLTLLLNRNWIAVSNFILSHTQSIFGISPKNWAVVYNPVTVDAGLKSKIDQLPALPGPYFLFVGSLSVRKGVLTIAKAAKQILSNGISVRFVFVGPETMHDARPISATVFEIVGENNRQRIEFLGRLNHADSLYWMRHAVAVVLPSQIESFGLVPLEAMTLGTPAIFTSESAGREIINNGIDGFLVGPNDVELLGDRMLELLENSELRATMSMAAAESVKRFSAQKFVVDCENAYRQMGAS